MLEFKKKIEIFEEELLCKNNSYADTIKEEIYSYYFEQLGECDDIENFSFLNFLDTEESIHEKVNLVVSKVIMHEHHAGVEDLISSGIIPRPLWGETI